MMDKIYEAWFSDGDYHDPVNIVGIYTNVDKAKSVLEEQKIHSSFSIEAVYIDCYELSGETYEFTHRLAIEYRSKDEHEKQWHISYKK